MNRLALYKTIKKTTLVSVLIILVSLSFSVSIVQAIEVIATIPVGSGPMGVAYDSGKNEIFVANGDNTVSVISDLSNSVVATISLPSSSLSPIDLVYDSGKGEIFVVNNPGELGMFTSSTVTVISDTNNSVITTISLGFNRVVGIAYNSAKGEIMVASQNPGGPVSIISDTSNGIISTVLVGGHPQGIVYDFGVGETFVSTEGDTTSWVAVISDNTNTVIANVTVDNVPLGLAYDFGKGEIFVASVSTPDLNSLLNPNVAVSVISDKSNTVVATVPMPIATVHLTYDSQQSQIFATYAGESNVTSIISDNTNMIIANVTVPNSYLQQLAYDSGRNEVFLTNPSNDTVTVISGLPTPPVTNSPTAASPSSTVPEFSWLMILPLFIFTLSIVILIRKRKD